MPNSSLKSSEKRECYTSVGRMTTNDIAGRKPTMVETDNRDSEDSNENDRFVDSSDSETSSESSDSSSTPTRPIRRRPQPRRSNSAESQIFHRDEDRNRRSTRNRRRPNRPLNDEFEYDYNVEYGCYILPENDQTGNEKLGIEQVLRMDTYFSNSRDTPDNYSFDDAWNHRTDCLKWRQAIADELEAMRRNHVYLVTELTKGRKAIGSRWVFKHKLTSSGVIDRFKARLVAKGYT